MIHHAICEESRLKSSHLMFFFITPFLFTLWSLILILIFSTMLLETKTFANSFGLLFYCSLINFACKVKINLGLQLKLISKSREISEIRIKFEYCISRIASYILKESLSLRCCEVLISSHFICNRHYT